MNKTAFYLVMFIIGQTVGIGSLAHDNIYGIFSIFGTAPSGYEALSRILRGVEHSI